MAIKMPHKAAKPATIDTKAEAFISGASLKAETPPSQKPKTEKKTVVDTCGLTPRCWIASMT